MGSICCGGDLELGPWKYWLVFFLISSSSPSSFLSPIPSFDHHVPQSTRPLRLPPDLRVVAHPVASSVTLDLRCFCRRKKHITSGQVRHEIAQNITLATSMPVNRETETNRHPISGLEGLGCEQLATQFLAVRPYCN